MKTLQPDYKINYIGDDFFITNNNKNENTKINNKIFEEQLFEYKIEDRKEFIDILIDWISECRNSDKHLMKDDLKYLMNIEDDYIFSSISTNEYITKEDVKEFNACCVELLDLNNKTN